MKYLTSTENKSSTVDSGYRPQRMTMAAYLQQQREQRGLDPLPIEPDLLIQRIKQGGYSGQFLADAFLSAYRKNHSFNHSLFELINLDAEGFRLFHSVIHMRHVRGWDDNALYEIEQKILQILTGEKQ